jgi:hypothetical protein
MQLPDATLSFHWKFEELPDDCSRLTTRLYLSGPNAKSFVDQARLFEQTTPEGMKKVAAAIERFHLGS